MPTAPRLDTPVRRSGVRAVTAVLVPVIICALAIGACGSSSSTTSGNIPAEKIKLNTAHVAHAIEQSVLQQRHVHASVLCPKSVPQEKGHHFVCVATVTTGKKPTSTPFAVIVQNDKGYVTYKGE